MPKPPRTPPWANAVRLQALREPFVPDPLDLAAYCRTPGHTLVLLQDSIGGLNKWLTLGQIELSPRQDRERWLFGARLGRGATDFEETSAWALRFELVGVQLDIVLGEQTSIGAYIAADSADEFHVPDLGWNPFEGAVPCSQKGCTPRRHPIVEWYVPPANPALYERVRGRRIDIRVVR